MWQVQDPSTGTLYPITQADQYPAGNITGPDGTVYSHDGGMQAYQQSQTTQPTQSPSDRRQLPPDGIHQVATAPNGVPVFQASDGSYYTQNADQSYTAQNFDAATIAGWQSSGSGSAGAPTTPAAPATTPAAGATPAPSGGGGGLITAYPGALPSAPAPPSFQAPAYTPPAPFVAPTWQQAADDPGFQFTQQQGQKGVEDSAAARGLLYAGGTLKDIAAWNQGLASTQYANVYNRAAQAYGTNYQTQVADPYTRAYTAASDDYASAWDQYKTAYQQWLDRINTSTGITTL